MARAQLHRLAKVTTADGKKRSISSLPLRVIHDERKPRKPRSSFVRFYMERLASGEFEGREFAETAKQIGQDWKALSAEESQVSDIDNTR